jgi:ribose transport system permease protein
MEAIQDNMENIGKASSSSVKAGITKLIPFVGLVFVVLFFEIITGWRLITPRNADVLLNEIYSVGLGCMGVLFVMTLGNLDLSMGAILGFSAMTGAFSARIGTPLILPVCLLTGLSIGLINGALYARFQMPAFIVTLGISFVLRGVTTVLLNGSISIPYRMSRFGNFGIKISVFLLVAVVVFIVFEFTALGKKTRATGSLPEAARQCGISLVKIRFIAFAISGLICGLVGFFSLIRSSTASNTTGNGFEFNVLLGMMIGGFSLTGGWTAKFRCVLVGSVIMGVISNGMTLGQVTGLTQQLIKGVIFITAVTLSFDRKNVAIIK